MRDQKQVCIDSAACWLCEAREHDTTDISGACPTCRADIVRLVDGEPPVIFTDGDADEILCRVLTPEHYDEARVSGEAWVSGKAQVLQVGPMGSRNALLTIYPEARRIVCSTGCFENKTLAELLAACAKTHGPDSPHTRDYTLLATAAFAVLEARIADANSGGPKDG